jgi:hypothetical protein
VRHATLLLLVIALAGCRTTPSSQEPVRPTTQSPADAPAPAWADEAPDFSDPRPPVPATSKASKVVESTRDRLLDTGH